MYKCNMKINREMKENERNEIGRMKIIYLKRDKYLRMSNINKVSFKV